MNITRIVKYTLVIMLLQIALSTLLNTVVGFERYASSRLGDYILIAIMPSSVLSFLLYGVMAYRSDNYAWRYTFYVYFLGSLLGTVTVSLILQEFYFFSETSIIELPVSLLVITLATLTGLQLQQKTNA
ncbi:hypothetical protein PS1M3_01020 [Pseudoalteromonas sp. PS1M3]|mgnify:FL=1|uniref:hypothetical protein n=1 Tax=Pseudoalteromonas TaxID=53246 RepID=UPI0002316E46|nr:MULTISPECIES: hypothetical protein [unclassified Pseudoalteromonas]MBL1386426.1 hypothetical protein [Colwellia sp.]MDA8938920.1 hypothetical protein [Pseudoalteromonas marina]MCK8123006.1 hypothetical protein [Pseudoalteromonas sp. 2CM32C]BBW90015.1 hypothetical protein PS1M3_01020 [Pseudoalteromonas sp. PS1M3]GAA73845.1 hypothetical protein P20480_0298 [Pseudoalteromonas sp. BSi20480]